MKAIKDLYPIYRRLFKKAVREMLNSDNRNLAHKSVFNGVRMFNLMPDLYSNKDEMHKFNVAVGIKDAVGFLTPTEFMTIFPPQKEYDGHKYDCKDYWSTMQEVNKLDLNTPIADQIDPLEFMFEYHNWDIHHFNVKVLGCLSNLRQSKGQLDLMEEFMAKQGMKTPNTFKSGSGDTLYVRNGKPEVISSVQSKKLKLVK
ncbi:hypothetical protein [Paraliobacillus sediminis]|uniref:hypothetical protein n=1 Tax=Paraliobacillus sediminis TaxID=1885916 RepID=UPI000E3BC494|nr:hypothetical protein [Paraliobacillus sediminis]